MEISRGTIVDVVDGDGSIVVDHFEVFSFFVCAAGVDGADRLLDGGEGERGGRGPGGLGSEVEVVEPLGEAVRVDAAAVRAAHGVGAPVRLRAQPVQDVLQRPVVHLVLVEQLLLADGLRLRL